METYTRQFHNNYVKRVAQEHSNDSNDNMYLQINLYLFKNLYLSYLHFVKSNLGVVWQKPASYI